MGGKQSRPCEGVICFAIIAAQTFMRLIRSGAYSAEIATDSGANRHALRRKSAVREVGAKRRWDFVHSLSVV
jgi:hypothetical protein